MVCTPLIRQERANDPMGSLSPALLHLREILNLEGGVKKGNRPDAVAGWEEQRTFHASPLKRLVWGQGLSSGCLKGGQDEAGR